MVVNLTFILLSGEVVKKTINKKSFVIGRSNTCDLVLQLEGVSRQHCQIDIEEGNYFVTDLGSTNGVLINGEKIIPHKKTAYPSFLPLAFGPFESVQIEFND